MEQLSCSSTLSYRFLSYSSSHSSILVKISVYCWWWFWYCNVESIHTSIIESIHFTVKDVYEELISLQCDKACGPDLLPSRLRVLNLLHLPWLNCFSYHSHLGSYHQNGLMLMLFQSTRKETNISQVTITQSAWHLLLSKLWRGSSIANLLQLLNSKIFLIAVNLVFATSVPLFPYF